MKYKVGDKVRIASKRTGYMNSEGKMDKYLKTIMTIKSELCNRYAMEEDCGVWFWNDEMIEGLQKGNEQMKTMTLEELKKRGLEKGDVYFLEHEYSDFNGWYLVMSNDLNIGLNAVCKGAFGESEASAACLKITKIIKTEDFSKCRYKRDVSAFFKSFNESLVKDIVTHIKSEVKMAKYVHAVHFGNSKSYTWRIPEKLENIIFEAGDIVEVNTKNGKQYVEVRETAECEYDERTKEVVRLIKTNVLPF